MGSFAVKAVRDAGATAPVLAVRGEIDVYTAQEFERSIAELVEGEELGLVIDLAGSAFVDASACRVLLRAARRLSDHGARLVVVNRDGEIGRIFKIMGLEEFLTVVDTRRDAQELLAG
jgi:anti-sigma B factor antagonist